MAVGDIETVERALHNKYGPLIRLGPNEVSCSDPASIPLVYRERNPLPKAPWYKTLRPQGISSQADLFSETNEDAHSRHRKIVGPVYQMANILKNEASIDDCINLFVRRLHEFADRKQELDFGHWLEMLAYDIIGRVQFGQTLGFLETGTDVGNWMESVTHALPLLHIAAAAPSYLITPVMLGAMLIPGMAKNFRAIGSITEKAKEMTEQRMKEEDAVSPEKKVQRHDVLSSLFAIQRLRGHDLTFTHREITLESWTGIIAGSDTLMRAVFYYLMRHPSTLSAAILELAAAEKEGKLSTPVQYSETISHLPYTCACIKEATRMFPSFVVRMRRVSPVGGMEVNGYHVPSGCWIGMNAAVVQRDKQLFGLDADAWRPERWMEGKEKRHEMEKGMLVFGAGTRTCTGKNVSQHFSAL
jgi:cytochrome P450